MAAIFAFKCRKCSRIHEGSPSFAFDSPWQCAGLTEDRKAAAELTADTCVIPHDQGADRFVRVTLEIPIHGVEDPFVWGVWVSLSEASFRRYLETAGDPDEGESWFGWFCNRLPGYEDTLNLKCRARPRKGGLRPRLELERSGHLLAEHLYAGLTVEQAQGIAERVMHDN